MQVLTILLLGAVLTVQLIHLILWIRKTNKSNEQLRMEARIDRLKDSMIDSLDKMNTNMNAGLFRSVEAHGTKSDLLKDSLVTSVNEFRTVLQGALDGIRNKVDERLDKMQSQLVNTLAVLQASNEKKLDEMRLVVNEKLEKTLETRLQKSFETVSTQLESVNKGLGEMKTVAQSVGSLNRILSNTKTRGILGELQLGQIIEDMLPIHLYDKEVSTKEGSRDRVEYAIKLPGHEEGKHVYLPIDSKFPLEDYYRLQEAYDAGEATVAEQCRKALITRIKQFAKDVRTKYVSPPETTNFAIIFLPTEGLYAEIVREPNVFEGLRQDGIIITGPTTLSAILSSLQVGFRTLQIHKSASDIEKTLGGVKKEFENFGAVLDKAHQRIKQADTEMETLVGRRTRAINRKLQDIQVYAGDDTHKLLGISDYVDEVEEVEEERENG